MGVGAVPEGGVAPSFDGGDIDEGLDVRREMGFLVD